MARVERERNAKRGRVGSLPVPITPSPLLAEERILPLAFRYLVFLLCCLGSLAAQADPPTLRVAAIGAEESALLSAILPKFEHRSGVKVQVLTKGAEQAQRLACNGGADVVLARETAAQKLVDDGCGADRRSVMRDDFVIVGPPEDEIGVAESKSAAEAFAAIAHTRAIFVSRGDGSDTNKKELALWQQAGLSPTGRWYQATSKGASAVLQKSAQYYGYTLVERSIWVTYRDKLPLKILLEKDPVLLHNTYSVVAVDPARHPGINHAGATALVDWITSPEGQQLIADYRVGGQVLFMPLISPAAK